MDIIQRGNPNILKSIQENAKKVSENKGISKKMSITDTIEKKPEAGAYFSMMNRNENNREDNIHEKRYDEREYIRNDNDRVYEKRLNDRLMESVETLGSTKEYFNATSSLFTLYAMGNLTEGVLGTISREDLREIKGIIREFKNIVDSY